MKADSFVAKISSRARRARPAEQEGILRLKSKYAWPVVKPNRDPNDFGWLSGGTERMLRRNLRRGTRLVVEIGSFMGRSAAFILRRAPKATLVCVDPWRDRDGETVTRQGLPHVCQEREGLYETFLVNLWSEQDRVIPMRSESRHAIPELSLMGLRPELFYVDGSHTYEDVASDLALIDTHHPNASILGDDYSPKWPGVVRAVDEFCAKHGFGLKLDRRSWSIVK